MLLQPTILMPTILCNHGILLLIMRSSISSLIDCFSKIINTFARQKNELSSKKASETG